MQANHSRPGERGAEQAMDDAMYRADAQGGQRETLARPRERAASEVERPAARAGSRRKERVDAISVGQVAQRVREHDS